MNDKQLEEAREKFYSAPIPEVEVDQEFINEIKEIEKEEELHPSEPMSLDDALKLLWE